MIATIDSLFMERMWRRLGCPAPPPAGVKRHVLKILLSAFRADVFVETGTYLGDTVASLKGHAHTIHSIELGDDLYQNATRRFARCPDVRLWHGDSAAVLPEVLTHIHSRCLFWLDGHYSEGITARGSQDTPIIEELKHIFSESLPPYLIAIDDARCFNGMNGYPCMHALLEFVAAAQPDFQVVAGWDAVYLIPENETTAVSALKKVFTR